MAKKYKYVQVGIAVILGNIIVLGLGANASLANSNDDLSQGLPGRRISGGTRHSENSVWEDCLQLFAQSADLNGSDHRTALAVR
ncbi:MAG: hypothetical protein AAF152_04705 [Cyanobacteria bacterium P01_A01_bin.114]